MAHDETAGEEVDRALVGRLQDAILEAIVAASPHADGEAVIAAAETLTALSSTWLMIAAQGYGRDNIELIQERLAELEQGIAPSLDAFDAFMRRQQDGR